MESLSWRVRSPRRLRRKRTTTSWVVTANRSERRQMPSPGAVWPAMVMYGSVIFSGEASVISPPTRKITMRGPLAMQASRKLPGPASFRLVTKMTLPPRPPTAMAPKPSASGNAGISRAAAAPASQQPAQASLRSHHFFPCDLSFLVDGQAAQERGEGALAGR